MHSQGQNLEVEKTQASPRACANSWTPSAAVLKLRADHEASRPALGAERAIHYTEFYKSCHEVSAPLRKAKALADHLSRRSIQICDGETIIGHHTEHRIGAICHVELAGVAMLADIFRFETRQTNPLYVNPTAKRKLAISVLPYWLTRNLAVKAFPFRKRMSYLRDQSVAARFVINEAGGVAHFLPNFEDVITQGTDGLRRRVQASLQQPGLSQREQDQLEANFISLGALEEFSDRYRELAASMGRRDIVEVLTNVPRRPPSNLREALQLIWFVQMIIQIESIDQGISLGRMDQYLYPLYLKEQAGGEFDPDGFRDLFCAFCLKLSEVIPLFSERLTEMFEGLPTGQAVTIGGIDAADKDASNELTFLLLDVIDQFKTRQPNWHARWSDQSDETYVARVFEVIGHGGGSPALYNDDVIIPSLGKRLDAPDELWNYATVGCVEPALPGISYTSSDAAIFNFARILETVLKQISEEGSPKIQIQTMPDVLEALEVELRAEVLSLKEYLEGIEYSNRDNHPVPFSSMMVEGCVESATDLTAGGARINASGIQAVGIADIANSLAAIDKLVFERGEISLAHLATACGQNFANDADLQAKLSSMDKFGNDKSRVDHFAGAMTKLFDTVISEHVNSRGGRWMSGLYSMTCHRSMGANTGALPSGRRAGEALADGISPTDGSDCLGPTASLNSVASLDPNHSPNGVNLNIKFDARTVKGPKGARLLTSLVEGYFDQGGMQVQINVLDPRVLLDAQQAPEKHRNLLVRISGYSAYFVDLSPAMQDEVIARTLQAA